MKPIQNSLLRMMVLWYAGRRAWKSFEKRFHFITANLSRSAFQGWHGLEKIVADEGDHIDESGRISQQGRNLHAHLPRRAALSASILSNFSHGKMERPKWP